MSKYNEADLERIRYQLGKVIKSWSKVDRVIEDDCVAYGVNDTLFCYLSADKLLLTQYDQELQESILSKLEPHRTDPGLELSTGKTPLIFSLQRYEFTELLPIIESVYRFTVISNH